MLNGKWESGIRRHSFSQVSLPAKVQGLLVVLALEQACLRSSSMLLETKEKQVVSAESNAPIGLH